MPCAGRVVCGLGLLLLMGCGLADYESRMKEAQQRLRQYEEEEKTLDPALRLNPPARVVEPNLPPMAILEFQLRAPRGIGSQPTAVPRAELFYDYLPVRANGAQPFQSLSIAFAPLKDDKFAANVLARIPPTTQPKQGTGKTRLGVSYRRVEFESETSVVVVHLFQGTANQFAVIFYVTKGQLARAARAIEMSLDTFGFDGTLGAARQAARPGGPLEYVPR